MKQALFFRIDQSVIDGLDAIAKKRQREAGKSVKITRSDVLREYVTAGVERDRPRRGRKPRAA